MKLIYFTFVCSTVSLVTLALPVQVNRSITIDNETFSVDKAPLPNSSLVQTEIKQLLGLVNLDDLVTDLGRVGNFTRLAYNGVAGYTELQIEVQRLGYDITTLADKSAITIHKFGTTAIAMVENLEATYGFLLEELEEFALEILSSCAELARQMAESAEELQKEFDFQANKTIRALENTQRQKGVEEDKIEQMNKQQVEYQYKMEQEQAFKKEAEAAAKEYESYYKEAEQRELDALKEAGNPLLKLAEAVIPLLDVTSTHEKTAESAREDKLQYLKMMQKQHEARLEANKKLIEFAWKLGSLNAEELDTEVAVRALFQAVGGLKHLSAIMKEVALFWHQLMTHCENLNSKKLRDVIDKALDYPVEKRNKLYISSVFKKNVMRYYSKWVALATVSETYMEQIKETRKDLYKYIRENYTIEESRKLAKELAKDFQDELKKAQEELQNQNSSLSNEINDLETQQQ